MRKNITRFFIFSTWFILPFFSFGQTQEDVEKYEKGLLLLEQKNIEKAIELFLSIKDGSPLDISKYYYLVISYNERYMNNGNRKDNSLDSTLYYANHYLKTYKEEDDPNYYFIITNILNELKKAKSQNVTVEGVNRLLEDKFKRGDFVGVLKEIEKYRKANNRIVPEIELDYFEAMSKYELVLTSQNIPYEDLFEINRLLLVFISKYRGTNEYIEEATQASTVLKKLIENYETKERFLPTLKIEKAEKTKNTVVKRDTLEKIDVQSLKYWRIGIEYGIIAHYGLRFEYTGKNRLGFFTNVRTSLAKDQDILNEKIIKNKNEVIIGPTVRLVPWLYLNLGVGVGYYSSIYRNDYDVVKDVRKTNYMATYGGATLKFGKIGISGGASFMDVGAALYKPEPTIGITYQIK